MDSPTAAPRMLLDIGATVVGLDIDHAETADMAAIAFASLATIAPAQVMARIEHAGGRHVLVVDGNELANSSEPTTLLDHLVSWMNREAVVGAAPELINLHAAAVVHPDTGRVVVVPGSPGAGKSTAAATALGAGWGYLSDELVAIDPAGRARPHPKPVTIKAGGTDVVDADLARWTISAGQRRWYVPAPVLGGHVWMHAQSPHAVLASTYVADGVADAHELSVAETLFELAGNTQDELDDGGVALGRLAGLAARAVGRRATCSSPSDVVPQLLACVEADVPDRPDPVVAVAAAAPSRSPGPSPVPGVVSVDCGDGGVLHRPDTSALVLLDAPGVLVWRLLDSTSGVDTIAEDLAAAFSEPVSRIRADVQALLTQLSTEGLLSGG